MGKQLPSVKAIFDHAHEIDSAAERSAYLDQACADAPDVRRKLDDLLKAYDEAGSFLESPPAAPPVTVDLPPVTERPGTVIGPYKLMEQIGEGGMGLVFVAEQLHPMRRKVAVKIIKPGMDTREVIARFEAERQALALMDHQNIARVLDAGATDTGRPYFVMELVKGIPIIDYCDQQQLTARERLEMFLSVCQAVQHAHSKGIIHRDLKPSNILVAPHDGVPVVKVIDFGVAKAIGQQLTEKTIYTRFTQMIGTPLYMSPEQAEINALDVDIRSDVYSLGVLLYELLTGTTPFDKQRFATAAYDEIRRIIKEEEPPKPSTRLSTLGETLSKVSAQRKTEPAKLSALVKGDLDWIVMKALEKDRNRRYETASAFAADVRRFLCDEPIEARPPSAGYRLRKFVRRNRVAVFLTLFVVATVASVLINHTVGYFQIRRERDRAMQAETDALVASEQEMQQRQLMEEERNRAKEAEKIAKANEREARMAAERAVEMMGLMDVFMAHAKDVAAAYQDKGKLDQAIAFYEEALAVLKTKLGTEHPSSFIGMANLASAYQVAGKHDQAIAFGELALPYMKSKAGPGPDHPATFAVMTNLAESYQAAGKRDKALAMYEEMYAAMKESFGPRHLVTFRGLSSLATAYWASGERDKALSLWQEMIDWQKSEEGSDHPSVLDNMNQLAQRYNDAGKPEQAVPLFEQLLPAAKKHRGDNDDYTLTMMNNLGVAYRDAWKLDKAIPLLEQTKAAREAKYGREHLHTLRSIQNLALAYTMAANVDQAIVLFEQTLAVREAKQGPDHNDTIDCTYALAEAYQVRGDYDKASPLYLKTLALERKRHDPDHVQVAGVLAPLGLIYLKQQKYAEAESLLRDCLRIRKEKLPDSWGTFNAEAMLGGALLGQKKYTEAEPLLVHGYEGLKQRESKIPPPARPRVAEALESLVQLYDALGNPAEAAKWRRELEARKPAE